jgi:oligopeptide transport system permease protein
MFFGITMALRKDKLYDHVTSTAVVFFISVPSFVIAALLQYVVAFRWGWFPIILEPVVGLTWEKFYSMILPILALSFGGIAGMSRMLRAELAETLTSEFMLLAKAKGLKYRQTIWRHALRNACVPMATTFLCLFLGILGSSIVIEQIFAVPGLSRLMLDSLRSNDHPLTLAIVYFYALIGLFMAILADLSYGIVDPRIRMGGRKSAE